MKIGLLESRLKSMKNLAYTITQISLLTAFSKIFEKVMYKTVNDFLNLNNILAGEQFGFRKTLN
jgi:hypothetical protein